MKFTHFKTLISKIENTKVGGSSIQYKLAPKSRQPHSKTFIEKSNPKKAGVLALFYPNEFDETKILLIKRASYNGPHSAQVSFPGGKFESKDSTLKNTALRETQEEVGVDSTKITIFKEFTDIYIEPSNFLVSPFLGYATNSIVFTKNHEVEAIIEVSISDLLDESAISTTIITTSYMKKVEVPCFKLNSYIVWGATAMMLNEIKELLKKM